MDQSQTDHWISILDKAEPVARSITPSRPCHYGRWAFALNSKLSTASTAQEVFSRLETLDRYYYLQSPFKSEAPFKLMTFAHTISRQKWPENSAHLVDFSLRFLEADVMLFESGYAKRRLLKRLRQAKLDLTQSKRVKALVRIAVIKGTGREEFKELCRLATKVLDASLHDWLTEQAEGAYITANDFTGDDIVNLEQLDRASQRKLMRYGWNLQPNYAIRPGMNFPIIKTSEFTEQTLSSRNAWRMLRHIEFFEASRPRS